MSEVGFVRDNLGRTRLYGIYSARVIDINDPLKKSRVKFTLHQATGLAKHGWAKACLPITSNANHPDHTEHTAASVAALLTTSSRSISASDPQGGTVSITVPALTVVAKNTNTLKHPHKTVLNKTEKWNDAQETAPTDEHSPHRIIPRKGQDIWIMFEGGDPEFPVWIGIQP